MKKSTAVISLLMAAATGAHAEAFVDTARVRSVDPQYERVAVPRKECNSQWINEVRRTDGAPQYGGAIVGGLAGALLGNQVGRGHGREAATALGAVVGAFTGDHLANADAQPRYQEVPREVTSCRTVSEIQTRLTGYRVGYEYRGQYYTTLMREDPGPNLQVRVSVDPVGR